MNQKLIPGLALVLGGGLPDCSTNPKFADVKHVSDGYGWDEITSHIFGIEGKVDGICKKGSSLKPIRIELIRPVPTAFGWIPYQKSREVIFFHFDESLSKFGKLQLTIGSVVKVAFGNGNGTQAKNPNDWTSNFSWLYVEENGQFYNLRGKVMDSEPDDGQNSMPAARL